MFDITTIVSIGIASLSFTATYYCIKSIREDIQQFQLINQQKISIHQLKNNSNNQPLIQKTIQNSKANKKGNRRVLIENVLPHFQANQFSIYASNMTAENNGFKQQLYGDNFDVIAYDGFQSGKLKKPYLISCMIQKTTILSTILQDRKDKYTPNQSKGLLHKVFSRFVPLTILGTIGLSLDQTIQLKAQFIGNNLQEILNYFEAEQNGKIGQAIIFGILGVITGGIALCSIYSLAKDTYKFINHDKQ